MKKSRYNGNFLVFFLILCLSILPLFPQDSQDISLSMDDGVSLIESLLLPEFALAEGEEDEDKPNDSAAGGVDVSMDDDGNIVLKGSGVDFNSTSKGSWNTLFDRYKHIIAGLSGFATLTMLAAFIYYLSKLGTTSGNDKARRECFMAILITGIATAGLGSVTVIMAFFYNAFAGL